MKYLFLIMLLSASKLFALQVDSYSYVRKFDEILYSRSAVNSINRMNELASRGNSIDFMHLSHDMGALNTMFTATKDVKYLEINQSLINKIFQNAQGSGINVGWSAKSNLQRFKEVNNQEVMLHEGYFAKYFAEYLYISRNSNLSDYKIHLKYLENLYLKWHSRSLKEFGDQSRVYGVRTHIGAQWATTALYLSKLTTLKRNRDIYKQYISVFDAKLKANLVLAKRANYSYYSWNSTWDKPFTKLQNSRRWSGKDRSEIQDVTHGNHVVHYILASQQFELSVWKKNDLALLSNTLKYVIWNSSNRGFSDDVDGSTSRDPSLKGTGWKQSDGWMKLMFYDNSLATIYNSFYRDNKEKIDKSTLNLQFLSNLALFQKLNN